MALVLVCEGGEEMLALLASLDAELLWLADLRGEDATGDEARACRSRSNIRRTDSAALVAASATSAVNCSTVIVTDMS